MKPLNFESKVSGQYRIKVSKADTGEITQDTGWFNNLITNNGLDKMCTTNVSGCTLYCQVGAGSSTPTYTDSALSSYVASTDTRSVSTGVVGTSYWYVNETFTFPVGSAAGNLAEIGVGWNSIGSLFSRALIVDGSGNATNITVLTNEILTITYQLRYYIPQNDITGTVTLDSINYNFTARAANCTSTDSAWFYFYAAESSHMFGSPSLVRCICYADAALGNISSYPSYSSTTDFLDCTITNGAYTTGSYSLASTLSLNISQANLTNGISGVALRLGLGIYQFVFNAGIPKDNTKTLSLTFIHSWGRY